MRLSEVKDIVSRQVETAGELADMLELSVDDILDRFADRLLEFKEKFGMYDEDDKA